MHRTVAPQTHRPPHDCNTMLGVGVVPFTMESLGVYLFAGAFRCLGTACGLVAGQKAPVARRPDLVLNPEWQFSQRQSKRRTNISFQLKIVLSTKTEEESSPSAGHVTLSTSSSGPRAG